MWLLLYTKLLGIFSGFMMSNVEIMRKQSEWIVGDCCSLICQLALLKCSHYLWSTELTLGMDTSYFKACFIGPGVQNKFHFSLSLVRVRKH